MTTLQQATSLIWALLDLHEKRVVVILRGLPGSGKSWFTQTLLQAMEGKFSTIKVSTDDFWGPEYKFDLRRLGEAHESTKEKFLAAMSAKTDLVIVDNTATQEWEYRFYKQLGEALGYKVLIAEMMCETTDQARAFFKRQTHGVPAEVYGAMVLRWQPADFGPDSLFIKS